MINIPLIITSGFCVFSIGLAGIFFNRQILISVLIALELTLLSINLILLTAASLMDDLFGIVCSVYIISVAAAESAIGLALIVS